MIRTTGLLTSNGRKLAVATAIYSIAVMAACFDGSCLNAADDDKSPPKSNSPQIAKTVPADGDKEVDPSLKQVEVTFDRDMDPRGMSWTGEIPVNKNQKAKWTNKRTCVLPVKLEPGTEYRIGFNSPSFKNFRDATGVPLEPAEIFFTTKTADPANKDSKPQDKTPKVVKFEPANGATDVDSAIKELKVTFNMPMGDGMSWTGGGDNFPKSPKGTKATWSADGLTCTLPVELEPNHEYQLGINSKNFKNFRSKVGRSVEPEIYKFKTAH